MPSAPVCIMENEAGSEYLFKKCSRKLLLQGDLSHHGVKEKYQPLYQKLVLTMANPTEVDTIWGKQLNIAGVKAAYLILMTSLLRIVIPLFR